MTGHGKVLAVITARGGSKGVPGKNLRKVAGQPLIAWTIAAARAARHIDRLILSSDDEAIIEVAKSLGCEVPFKRASHLASDSAPSIEVVLDALDRCPGFEYVVLLQPTSPLRTAGDIDGAIMLCNKSAAPACVSVCEAEQSPYWMFTLEAGQRIRPLLPGPAPTRRQDLPRVFVLNGAVYVADVAALRSSRSFITPETVAYEMPAERSLDIDTEADLGALESRLS